MYGLPQKCTANNMPMINKQRGTGTESIKISSCSSFISDAGLHASF